MNSSGNASSILIVEDDSELLSMYRLHAKSLFNPVYIASSCEKARSILAKRRVDCIILDNILPDGQGISIITEMNLDKKNIIVILISGFADKKLLIESLNRHVFYFIEKPFGKNELINVLNESLKSLIAQRKKDEIIELYTISDPVINYLKENNKISKREIEVMSCSLQLTNNEVIGNNLLISSGTVKKHLSNIFRKLSISSKYELRLYINKLNRMFSK